MFQDDHRFQIHSPVLQFEDRYSLSMMQTSPPPKTYSMSECVDLELDPLWLVKSLKLVL